MSCYDRINDGTVTEAKMPEPTMADTAFYVCGDQKQSSWLVDQVGALKELASKMGIWNIVHARAVEIYDFRNSGKQGYTLKDGKIVKEEGNESS